jgi:hypothetical protein
MLLWGETAGDALVARGGIFYMKGFIQLAPKQVFAGHCPECDCLVDAHDWKLPGLWIFAQFKCRHCGTEFLSDLPYSLGFMSPCSVNIRTGVAKSKSVNEWYASLSSSAWKNRLDTDIQVDVKRSDYGKNICIVNCLYPWWGDSVNLLLRVNLLKNIEGMDIVVVINPTMLWLVPDFVKGVWIVQQKILDNSNWNESIDAKIKAIVQEQNLNVFLPVTYQSAYLTQEELRDACRIASFPRNEWLSRLKTRAVVTFMIRRDRCWASTNYRRPKTRRNFVSRIVECLERKSEILRNIKARYLNRAQLKNVRALARELKRSLPNLEFAVCGLGREGDLPSWIKDLRVDNIDGATNVTWAEQSARSHVFVGVHGSHTSLFASLAGACIELTPNDRLKNILQCSPITSREPREAVYCNRFLPIGTDYCYLADTIAGVILNYPYISMAVSDLLNHPLDVAEFEQIQAKLAQRQEVIQPLDKEYLAHLAN